MLRDTVARWNVHARPLRGPSQCGISLEIAQAAFGMVTQAGASYGMTRREVDRADPEHP